MRYRASVIILLGWVSASVMAAQQAPSKPRARDLDIPFDGTPGPFNAITDVAGVEVGETTIIEGTGEHAARTGVTIVWPEGKVWAPVFAGWFAARSNSTRCRVLWPA